MKSIAEIGGSHLATVHIVAVALVDDDAVGDLHNATLDALQLVASASHLDEQEEVDHRVTGGLALPYSNGLDEDLVEAGSLAEDDGLTRLASHTAEGTCGRAGTDEGVGMLGELLHTCLVAEDGAFGALAGGVDGEDGQTPALLFQHVDAKLVDTRRLACARDATDAHTDTVAAIRQTLVDDLLGTSLVVRIDALDEGDGLREDGDVALEDALYHLADGEFPAARTLEVWVHDRWLVDTAVHLQACIF